MNKYLFLLFLFIACNQNPFVNEQKDYELSGLQTNCDDTSDNCIDLVECGDNNSNCKFITLNENITSVGNDILLTQNNNFLVTGYQKNNGEALIWIELINEDGTSISNSVGGTNTDYGFDAIELDNGNFLILGSTNSYGEGDFDIIIYKLNSQLEQIDYFTLGSTNYDGAASFIKTFDNNFLILSSSRPINSGNYNIVIDKIDSEGNMVKNEEYEELHYSIGNDYEQLGHHIIELQDSTIFFSGYSQSDRNTKGLWFGKLDANYNIVCQDNFGQGDFSNFTSKMIEIPDTDQIIIAGTYNDDLIIANIDTECNVNWEKYFGSEKNEVFTSMVYNNGIIVSAISKDDDDKEFIWLFKVDDFGNLLWEKKIEHENDIRGFDLINNNNESITLTGSYIDKNNLKAYYLTISLP